VQVLSVQVQPYRCVQLMKHAVDKKLQKTITCKNICSVNSKKMKYDASNLFLNGHMRNQVFFSSEKCEISEIFSKLTLSPKTPPFKSKFFSKEINIFYLKYIYVHIYCVTIHSIISKIIWMISEGSCDTEDWKIIF